MNAPSKAQVSCIPPRLSGLCRRVMMRNPVLPSKRRKSCRCGSGNALHSLASCGGGEPQPDSIFSGVAEGWIADVMGQAGRSHHRAEVLRVEASVLVTADHAVADHRPQRPPHARHFKAVSQGEDIVALRERKNLGFVLQAPECRGKTRYGRSRAENRCGLGWRGAGGTAPDGCGKAEGSNPCSTAGG